MDSCGGVPQGKPQYVKEVDSDKHEFPFTQFLGKYIYFSRDKYFTLVRQHYFSVI